MMGGSVEEGGQGQGIMNLERLDLNGHVNEGDRDASEFVEMRVKYEEDLPVRVGAESAPALGVAESEAMKRYTNDSLSGNLQISSIKAISSVTYYNFDKVLSAASCTILFVKCT